MMIEVLLSFIAGALLYGLLVPEEDRKNEIGMTISITLILTAVIWFVAWAVSGLLAAIPHG
jgi:biotin transporter BioY